MRFTTKAAALAAALVTSTAVAGAQGGTTVAGTTSGCFNTLAACMAGGFASTASYVIAGTGEKVNFNGASFSGTTGFTGAFTVGNFGSFVLMPAPNGATPNTLFDSPFTLLFTLTNPAGANSPTTTFAVAGSVGSVMSNGMSVGTRDISYAGGTTAFTFTGGSGTITVNPDAIGVAANNIGGRVTATALASTVPEPSTYALMGMGLSGLLVAVRRRRSA